MNTVSRLSNNELRTFNGGFLKASISISVPPIVDPVYPFADPSALLVPLQKRKG